MGTGKCKRKPSFVQYSVLWTSARSKAKLFKIGARGLVKASFPMTYETGLLPGNTVMYMSNTRTSRKGRKQASKSRSFQLEIRASGGELL